MQSEFGLLLSSKSGFNYLALYQVPVVLYNLQIRLQLNYNTLLAENSLLRFGYLDLVGPQTWVITRIEEFSRHMASCRAMSLTIGGKIFLSFLHDKEPFFVGSSSQFDFSAVIF